MRTTTVFVREGEGEGDKKWNWVVEIYRWESWDSNFKMWAAELEALVDVIKRMPLYENHIECLWGRNLKVFILTES